MLDVMLPEIAIFALRAMLGLVEGVLNVRVIPGDGAAELWLMSRREARLSLSIGAFGHGLLLADVLNKCLGVKKSVRSLLRDRNRMDGGRRGHWDYMLMMRVADVMVGRPIR